MLKERKRKKKRATTMYKTNCFFGFSKGYCLFAKADFSAKNPRSLIRNYFYTRPLPTIATLNSKRVIPNIKTTDFKLALIVFS
ncbi:hypothetical protein, partial [Olleya marilimosa]|uniref:hypothetical protein n=1 Tax=Olleya marilimosa TaxID=272164 RepID=UPI001E659F55